MVRNILIQVVVFALIFNVLSYFKELPMLDKGTELAVEQIVLFDLKESQQPLFETGKTQIIYFFAPWCQICHASISNLQSIYLDKPEISIKAIALDYASVNEIRQFSSQHDLSFPILLGDSELKKRFKIQGYPSYYVLNERGEVKSKSLGYSTELGLNIRSL